MAAISSTAASFGKPETFSKFNGIEHTTDLELNQYDAFYRNLDPQTGRWFQIDPKPNHSESQYSLVGNNPLSFSDYLGDTLRVDGSGIAQSEFIRLSNDALGGFYNTTIDNDGTVSFTSTGKEGRMKKSQRMFYKQISKVMKQTRTTNIHLVHKDDPGRLDNITIVGNINFATLDVSDIAAIKNGKAITQAGTLVHEIIEENYYQENDYLPVDEHHSKHDAHLKGIEAEAKVTGWYRIPKSFVDNTKPATGGGPTGTYNWTFVKDLSLWDLINPLQRPPQTIKASLHVTAGNVDVDKPVTEQTITQ